MFTLEVKDLKKDMGARTLFEIQHLTAKHGDKIGIVGRNGTGKTTLLEILAGEAEADAGTVFRDGETGYIRQINPQDERLSGGEKTRKLIQEVLRTRPELLFADEPTSNLDADSAAHLKRDFKKFAGTIFVISHDRDFLDAICSEIWELEGETVTRYKGNYTAYRKQKSQEQEMQQKAYTENVAEKKRLESAISYRKDMAGSMDAKQEKLFKKGLTRKEVAYGKMFKGVQQKSQHKTIKATEKRLSRLEHVDKPFQFKPVKITLPETRRLKKGTTLLQISKGDVTVPGKKLFQTEAFSLKIGDKVALVGKNASGKTSFLRAVLNEDDFIRRTKEVRIAYFDQELAGLKLSDTLIENVNRVNAHDKQLAMDVLGSMHFTQADLNKKVTILSGGERVKLYLSMILLSDANLLILDEPTNYLDIDAMEALEGMIRGFDGAVLFVSHDGAFVRNVSEQVIRIQDGTMKWIPKAMTDILKEEDSSKETVAEDKLVVQLRLTEIAAKLSDPKISAAEKEKLNEAYLENSRILRQLEK
ncbi:MULTISPECIES: ribosomal protection-like ABC-F family protein [Listeria]|uniref:ribosomal protection-like ABC-F family protein n=1 Tax=Listeria TaxID=1637 RepID=UPI000B592C11|nr:MULTISPECIES: ABC-F family ATP-binding cassette domain-containing protein [Listeria]